jgi:hypothetical protein
MDGQGNRRFGNLTRQIPRLIMAGLIVVVASVSGIGESAVSATPLPSNCRGDAAVVTCTLSYNGTDGSDGTVQKFLAPDGVTGVTIEAWGAQGGDVEGAVGGPGGYSKGTVAVIPGAVLDVRVGGMPTSRGGGFNGGGSAGPQLSAYSGAAGGGATDVRLGGDALSDRIVVAAGGGGSAYSSGLASIDSEYDDYGIALGGDGGGPSGTQSVSCTDSPWQACGQGGSASDGGTAGTTAGPTCARDGTRGSGGKGCGGGGGGGYFGGGGGGFIDVNCCGLAGVPLVGPGGGGSGFVTAGATGVRTQAGIQFGEGMVRISYVSQRPHPGLTWAPPSLIDSTGAMLSGISCPSTTFCVAVDSAGNAAIDKAGTWSTFAPVDGPGNSFTAVSCASVTFCVAVGTAPPSDEYDQDLAVIYNHGVWSFNASVSVAPVENLTSVTCAPNTEFCTVVGWAPTSPGLTMVSETYHGRKWTASDDGMGYGSSGDMLTTVSCASRTFCIRGGILQARSDIGDLLAINYRGQGGGGQITNEEVDGISGEINASSCAGHACWAAGDGDLVFSVERATWSGPTAPDGPSTITALSCVTSTTCFAVDNNGNTLRATSSSWSAPLPVDPGRELTAISCPTVGFCAAVDSAGDVVIGS